MTRSFDASRIDSFASGAWPLLSLVSDDRTARGLRCGLALGEFSCCEFLVGEMLSDYRNYERIQPLQGVTAHVADVQAERELIHIAMQVLLGNLVVDAVHAALEHSPDAFDTVRADSTLGVDSGLVVNGLVAKEKAAKAAVPGRLIREDRGADFNVRVDSRLQRSHVGCFDGHCYSASAALPESYDSRL